MKQKVNIFNIIVNIVLSFLVLLHILDFIDLAQEPGAYPFGSAFVTTYSTYRSETIYVLYGITSTIIYLLTIYFALINKQKWLIVFLILSLIFFFYPIVTASY